MRRKNTILAKTNPGTRKKLRHEFSGSMVPGHVISVALVGAGGSGSYMVSRLVEIDMALRAKGKPGLAVTVYDPDIITTANVGRQKFYPSEVGLYKSIALIDRVNKGFGLGWTASIESYRNQMGDGALGRSSTFSTFSAYDILITCVDTAAARRSIYEGCLEQGWGMIPKYWMDMGNDQTTGQVVLGQFSTEYQPKSDKGTRLLNVIEMFPAHYAETVVEDDLPSCSLAEALNKQDLFINLHVTSWASQLLWRLLDKGVIDCQGYWVNLDDGSSVAMPIREFMSDDISEKAMKDRESTWFQRRKFSGANQVA